MTPEQKQRAVDLIDVTKTYRLDAEECAMQMAALLQELVDAPESEPVAYATGYYAGYLSIATVDGRVLPTGTALYTAPPVPSVPDMRLTGQWESSRIADYNRGWNECRQAMLSAAPTPAEAPAQDFEDALEQAFWDFDARHKGYKKTIRPISERDAFKQVLRNFMHEHGGAEAPADVARDGWKNAAEWLRNNYQDYPNISSLCEAMVAQSANNGGN